MERFSADKDRAEAHAGRALLGVRPTIEVSIPGTEIAGRMRVLTRAETLEVKQRALELFRARGMVATDGSIVVAAHDDWRSEIAVLHLAQAVRDPEDESRPLAAVEDWRELTDEQISGPWDAYQDLRDSYDPLGPDARSLTEAEVVAIRAAAKKKDVVVLRSYGLHRLALYATTTVDPPSS